jgi:hypothetical protein
VGLPILIREEILIQILRVESKDTTGLLFYKVGQQSPRLGRVIYLIEYIALQQEGQESLQMSSRHDSKHCVGI